MNKSKKIAMSVVSIVMAGALVVPLAACDPGNGGGGSTTKRTTVIPETRFNAAAADIETKNGVSVLKSDNTKLAYPSGTPINVNIIDSDNADRKISYDSGQIATYWTAVDGYTYTVGDLKPAWWQLGQTLGIKFNDVAQSNRKSKELSEAAGPNDDISKYTLINASITETETYKSELLDLSQYLDYMPNFKNFLAEYPIVEMSIKMNPDDTGMYYIPYFDGNDDIEKYELVQRDWVKTLLDEELPATDNTITYLAQYKAKVNSGASSVTTAVEPFMGTTGSWSVDTTKSDGSGEAGDKNLVVSYDNVITALGNDNSDLKKAIVAAGVTNPQTASGNIISIQNDIISNNPNVKGSALVKVLREYIKTAYTLDGAAYETLSDVFLSSSGAWDVDLLIALFRCVVTSYQLIDNAKLAAAPATEIYALAGREATPQRENDLMALAGELYGVRGLESRFGYSYIGSDGELKDARVEEASYNAAAKLNALAKEGLLYTETGTAATGVVKYYTAGKITTFMLHDYVQTQTTDGFTHKDDFDLAPIVTPVSKWDDGTGVKEMRFTESWRSVKNSGVVIPKKAVEGKPNVLSAVLTFVDYLFSNDGQIIGSYGPMSTNGNGADANGFWYGKNGVPVLDENGDLKSEYEGKVTTVDGVQYFLVPDERGNGFMFDNVLYEGLQYKDNKQIPIMTDNNKNFYVGETVNGVKMSANNKLGYKKDHIGKYTDYARGVVGAALPIGNKDQGFEFQCTADCGLDGAKVVSVALGNETIKHVVQEKVSNWWYTVCPSAFPVDDVTSNALGFGNGTLKGNDTSPAVFNATGGKTVSNVYIDIAFYGFHTGSGNPINIGSCGKTTGGVSNLYMASDAAAMITAIKALGGNSAYLQYEVNTYATAWGVIKAKLA